ncbi:sugar phosphate isomerase/epimerase [Patescibacteria group bacterium]|nr:sugar phosphate isomerase/epimerase [Patescibacteria group bacterium]
MLALSTDSLNGYGLNRIFQFAKEAGYDGIDLAISERNFDSQNAQYIKSLSIQYGLPILAVQLLEATPKRIQDTVDLAKIVETKVIIIQPPRILNFKQTAWLKREVPKIRAKENISIALENAPDDLILGIIPKHAMNNLVEMKKFKHAAIDTTRIAIKRQDLIRVYKSLQKYLVHIHLSNVKGSKQYYLPEDGILPLESFLTKLSQDEFPGTISIKVNPKFLNAGDDEKLLKHLKDTKEFYEKFFIRPSFA